VHRGRASEDSPVAGNAYNEFLDPAQRPVLFSRSAATKTAMPAFLRLGDIKGESGDARFPGWIPLESVSLPQSRQGRGIGGQGRAQEFLGDITVTMRHGSASSEVANAAATGRLFPSVTIVIDEGMTIELTDVFLSGYSFHSGGTVPVETITMNSKRIEFIPQVQFPAKPGGPPASNDSGYGLKRPKGRR